MIQWRPLHGLVSLLVLACDSSLIQASFTEELLVHPLSDGATLVHFQFESQLVASDKVFPKAIQNLLVNLPVQELDLAFVHGRWFADRWGPPQTPVTPPGATLRTRFFPHMQDMESMRSAWGNLTHTLSGLFCSSLNFLADASMAAMPVHAFGRHNTDTAKQWFYGSLPREAVCTENLTPWLKLLPCQGRQGLTQLMDRPTLYGASFHSLRVHLLVHNQPQDTCTADGDKTASSDGLTATLTQTLTLVLRPEQMHTQEKVKSKFSNHGKVVHRHIDLQRLFNVPGAATCSKAAHTHIYFHLPRSLIANSDPGDNTSDLHAVDNKLYSASPAPDAVVSSASAVFLLYNVTASKQQSEQSEQCLQPSITWHQQPDAWKAETPPVRQFVAGRFGDRGSLVLQLHMNAVAQAGLLNDSPEEGAGINSTVPGSQSLRFCIFQMVPWYFRLLFHTMRLHVDDQDVHFDDVLLAHHLEPAEGPGTTGLIELCLRLPAATSFVSLTIDFQKAFLTVFDHPPDAHRGFDIPAALITFMDAKPDHQEPWTLTQRTHAPPDTASLASHGVLQHLATFAGQHVYTTGVLVPLPTPDFSMPYNVCCMTCTVLAIYILGVTSLVFGKPEDEKSNAKAARQKRFILLAVLLVGFLGMAIALDKSLQRQLEQTFVDLGLMKEPD